MSAVLSAPWNLDRCVGPRKALTPEQVQRLDRHLETSPSLHDRCLLHLAVDSMLRCSDLLALRVQDVMHPSGDTRKDFAMKQKKTGAAVYPVLTPMTQKICRRWVDTSGKQHGDFLFTRGKGRNSQPISPGFYRQLIKDWVSAIGLESEHYSSHSLRRTKPVFLYRQGVPIEDIAQLLGHKDTKTTLRYLGLSLEKAQAQALAFDIFADHTATKKRPHARSLLTPVQMEELATVITQKLVQSLQGRPTP